MRATIFALSFIALFTIFSETSAAPLPPHAGLDMLRFPGLPTWNVPKAADKRMCVSDCREVLIPASSSASSVDLSTVSFSAASSEASTVPSATSASAEPAATSASSNSSTTSDDSISDSAMTLAKFFDAILKAFSSSSSSSTSTAAVEATPSSAL
ncbi:uncharacterized protein STEHIDRAFT_169855 [Stereum hirsutum FP-91666 SS1]|uniref:uncharacterized protein n=1 Tax=Stereum hirsutum (strain FP-91666) TaxID=721885 RepID=UPI000444A041|nr:uncharacterized protein STEHIDRAFT_169855 [Stereum hirsutum FP-91666 SS1]EIM85018.1 hypothetical protein STEHIDRAFT_169855 [Stereum hirsutum FP-91666 SS1]